jgi:hypothetical protein
MQLGRIYGFLLVIFGTFITWLAYSMLDEAGLTLKVFMAGPTLFGLGIGFLIFPGGNITAKESKEKTKNPQVVVKEAPMLHKIVWVVCAVVGFIASQFIFKF